MVSISVNTDPMVKWQAQSLPILNGSIQQFAGSETVFSRRAGNQIPAAGPLISV